MPSSRFLALSALALLLAAALPAPDAQAQSPAQPPACDERQAVRYTFCVERIHAWPGLKGTIDNLYRVAYSPKPNPFSGLHEALIVGGLAGEFTLGLPQRGVVFMFDGISVTKVFQRDGPQFVDVAWAPDGSYALIISDRKAILRVDPPSKEQGRLNYRFTDLWADCANVEVTNCQQATYLGRGVSFHPSGAYAWITGSSLLQYDGRNLSVIEQGTDIAYRAIAWNPAGNRALLSAVVCTEPGNPAVDAPCVDNVTENRLVLGRILHADISTQKICEVHTYGRFDDRKAEVNGITWHPSGNYALLYGDDNFHGTILKFDAAQAATGTNERGCPKFEHNWKWLNVTKAEGEFNAMAYNPKTGRYWAVGSAGQEVWEGDGETFRYFIGEHDMTGGKGTLYYGVAWEPSSYSYFLVSGFDGRLYKFLPATHPLTRVNTPKNNSLAAGPVLIAGQSFAPSEFEQVERAEVRVRPVALAVAPAGNASAWMQAEVTGFARGFVNWSFPWNHTQFPVGYYHIRARALTGTQEVEVFNRTVQLFTPRGLASPALDAIPPSRADLNYSAEWRASHVRGPWEMRMGASGLVTGGALGAGPLQAEPAKVEVQVQRVEVSLQPTGDGEGTGWLPAGITGRSRSAGNWSTTWDATNVPSGFYQVQARGLLKGVWSNLSNRTIEVVPPRVLAPPALEPLPARDDDGNFTVRWSSAATGTGFELEEAWQAAEPERGEGDPFSGNQRLVYQGSLTHVDLTGRADGQYVYRVRARTADGISPWSQPSSTVVAIDSDGDGVPDALEVARGSDPRNATSSPDDIDGDGVPNDRDAFPLDPTESKDTDGDRIGDRRDRFPLDPRDWADTDEDTWGDSAEARLGSDPHSARSTPETDDDGDGCRNQDEAAARTDPRSPASAPAWCKLGGGGSPIPGSKATPAAPLAALVAAFAVAAALRRRRAP